MFLRFKATEGWHTLGQITALQPQFCSVWSTHFKIICVGSQHLNIKRLYLEQSWISEFCGKCEQHWSTFPHGSCGLESDSSRCLQLGHGLDFVSLLWTALLIHVTLCPYRYRSLQPLTLALQRKNRTKFVSRSKQYVEYVFLVTSFKTKEIYVYDLQESVYNL